MKDWDEYKVKLPYPDRKLRKDKQSELVAAIDNAKMTTGERAAAMAGVPREVSTWWETQMAPYQAEEQRLTALFWEDCREDLGYTEFLNETGVAALEKEAYDRGHSAGFSEVHCVLSDLTDLARTLVDNRKERDG